MKDIQYKSVKNQTLSIADGNYAPALPMGTIEMVNNSYKQWLIRRGFACEESVNSFNGSLRGASKRSAIAAKNKKKITTSKK